MKLNGWIRLWLVLTTMHIAGVSVWTAVEWPSLPDDRYSSDQNGVIHMISDMSGKHYYFAKDFSIQEAKDHIRLEEGAHKVERELREVVAKKSTAIMLIPPAVVLLLGYALNWIRRGFKDGQ